MKFPTIYHEDDTEEELPYRWIICGGCRGHGKSSAYLGAFTREDMDEQGPDFVEDYMRGFYDRACEKCDGSGKVAVADTSRMTKEQRAAWREQCRDEAEMRAIEAAERRMGA